MKNRRHRRRHHHRLRNPMIWIGLIITFFLTLLVWGKVKDLIDDLQPKGRVMEQVIGLANSQEHLYVEDANRPRVYPYSVVDGGVHSVQELRSAVCRDPIVANHYSNFKLDRAKVIEASANGDFHVSYRIGDEIFWTKKRLKVAKGERLITDGTNFTRTRCANMLSEVLPQRTSPDEPSPEVFDTPKLLPSDSPILTSVMTGQEPSTTSLGLSEPISMPPVIAEGGPPGPGPGPMPPPGPIPPGPIPPPGPRPPTPVPEPSTMLLLGAGLIGLAGYGRKKFFKK